MGVVAVIVLFRHVGHTWSITGWGVVAAWVLGVFLLKLAGRRD